MYSENLGLYLLMLYLLSGMRFLGLLLMLFCPSGARVRRPVFLGRTVGPVVPLRLAALPLSEVVCYVFAGDVLLGGRAVGGRGSSRLFRVSHGDEVDGHCAQYCVNFLCSNLPLS